ncbi:hypothetical protein BJ684DRAFT_19777 [Piptocephalis cylindrospora]|uniref:Uncharacterized protein n=1 Tax=Piptocephalis cylindrospora TaxID=1907219 RepID=A0A4P9Y4H4_9FUNG|nr:hypothetical protein BJ684DRAFT_19777 [Piptocephalis cylindrospora]|eukprot:RKP13763.1 hypothetical protein BJ684DRAFT_19777 [Piptocephalis cylindrospora]
MRTSALSLIALVAIIGALVPTAESAPTPAPWWSFDYNPVSSFAYFGGIDSALVSGDDGDDAQAKSIKAAAREQAKAAKQPRTNHQGAYLREVPIGYQNSERRIKAYEQMARLHDPMTKILPVKDARENHRPHLIATIHPVINMRSSSLSIVLVAAIALFVSPAQSVPTPWFSNNYFASVWAPGTLWAGNNAAALTSNNDPKAQEKLLEDQSASAANGTVTPESAPAKRSPEKDN